MPTSPSEQPDDVADVAVVGAGPAGIAAAVGAVLLNFARVVVLDGEQRPGGQYWRHGPDGVGRRHHDRRVWQQEKARFDDAVNAGFVDHRQGHRVWRIDPPGTADDQYAVVHAVRSVPGARDVAVTVRARAVVLAPGAHDRVLPFPGWDLPGVVTAGAAQAMLKEHGVVVGSRVVVAGTGPFLLPVAAGLAADGARVVALCEAGDGRGWLRRPGVVAGVPAKLLEGAGFVAALARHRVRPRLRTAVVAAHGTDRVEWVEVARLSADWTVVPGSRRRVDCDAVAVGWGFLPRLDLAVAAGCATTAGPGGVPSLVVDDTFATSVPGIWAAGEVTGVGGALLAVEEGETAGMHAAAVATGDGPLAAAPVPSKVRRLRAFADLLHAAHPVRDGWQTWLDDATTVCRCEEVTVAGLVEAVDGLGATDARTAKLLSRCGMGWCQGRMCGEAVSRIVSARTGCDAATSAARLVTDLAGTANRPVAAPVTLGLLATADEPPPPPP